MKIDNIILKTDNLSVCQVRIRVLCQRAVPYELYTGLTFTTIWLETTGFEGKCESSADEAGLFYV